MLAIEVGGSSVQATLFAADGTFQLVTLSEHRHEPWAYAAPGLIDGDRVRLAHHIGWMDTLASHELGMSAPPLLGMNDADASSLGEWILQSKPPGRMFYLVMGTGIGATMVEEGKITPIEFGHLPGFGPKFCGGCMNYCLDAQIGGHALPTPLGKDDIDFIVEILHRAITQENIDASMMVMAGGMNRLHPEIREQLAEMVPFPVLGSRTPDGMKSAAPFGLWFQLPR